MTLHSPGHRTPFSKPPLCFWHGASSTSADLHRRVSCMLSRPRSSGQVCHPIFSCHAVTGTTSPLVSSSEPGCLKTPKCYSGGDTALHSRSGLLHSSCPPASQQEAKASFQTLVRPALHPTAARRPPGPPGTCLGSPRHPHLTVLSLLPGAQSTRRPGLCLLPEATRQAFRMD